MSFVTVIQQHSNGKLTPFMKFCKFYVILTVIMCDCNEDIASIDLVTPRNVLLTAFYKRSFAFYTVKVRMPVILTQVIDTLARSKDEIKETYGDPASEELKHVIGELSKFKYEIQTNKPIELLKSDEKDIPFYNSYLYKLRAVEGANTNYFNTVWLYVECYMYRRIREIFYLTSTLKNFDPFQKQKRESFAQAIVSMRKLAAHLLDVFKKENVDLKEEFITLLKLNLWGNKMDLSLSLGKIENSDSLFNKEELNNNLLVDDSEKIWNVVSNASSKKDTIDIILDNSGYELFCDLCLADFLVTNNFAKKIRFHPKTIPWFISDTTPEDFAWVLQEIKKGCTCDKRLGILSDKWSDYVQNNVFVVEERDHWTLPCTYPEMIEYDEDLYNELVDSKLAIFKGDVNYRKLFGEKNWNPVKPVDDALQGFRPTDICILRVMKSHIVCGLPEGVADKTEKENEDWMTAGIYGLISYGSREPPLEEEQGEKEKAKDDCVCPKRKKK